MKFISTKGMTNETAPEGQMLVQYLEQSWGTFSVEFTTGYFDNPNDYTDGAGRGWLDWYRDFEINVIAYCELPKPNESRFTKMQQLDFYKEFGSWTPNMGNLGE